LLTREPAALVEDAAVVVLLALADLVVFAVFAVFTDFVVLAFLVVFLAAFLVAFFFERIGVFLRPLAVVCPALRLAEAFFRVVVFLPVFFDVIGSSCRQAPTKRPNTD